MHSPYCSIYNLQIYCTRKDNRYSYSACTTNTPSILGYLGSVLQLGGQWWSKLTVEKQKPANVCCPNLKNETMRNVAVDFSKLWQIR